jgi:glycosyltransferase involved in cell wall biosynthesis
VSEESRERALPALPVLSLLMVTPGRIASTQIFDLVFQGLAEQGAIAYRALYDSESSPEERREAVLEADVVFFLRSFQETSLDLLRFAKQHGKLAVYSTDDDFRELDPETPLGRVHLEPAAIHAYESLIAEADLLWLYTEEMRRRYQPIARRVVIGRLPSFVEINGPRSASSLAASEDAVLVIGYGGSSTHESDLRVVIRPLLDVLDAHQHVRAQFINYAPKELARHPRVEVRPFLGSLVSYYEFLRQARWSIGLAPLEDTSFNRGKTSNKYREYAGLGIPGIYSRMPVYAECVRHLETGVLADHDEKSFAAALGQLVESPELRRTIRLRGLQDASSTYSLRGTQLHFLREISRLAVGVRYAGWRRPSVLAVGYASTSSMQIGALQPLAQLAQEGWVEYRHVEPDALATGGLEGVDAAFVLRAFEERTLPLLDWAREHHVPLIAAWDDDFLEIPPGTPIGDYYRHPSVVRPIERFLSEASLVVASTPPLFARSSEYNEELLEAIYGLDESAVPTGAADEPADRPMDDRLRVGFFGSNDALAQPWMVEALSALRRRYGDRLALEAIGIDPPPGLRALLDWWQPGVLPYAESLRLLRSRNWSVGLAPLGDTIFNAAKQATKLRDYAWAGVPMVCSRVPAYERAVLDGIHCRLAENTPAAWVEATGELLDDPQNARDLARGAGMLLEAVHVQSITNASWKQLLWRIGARRRATGADLRTSTGDRRSWIDLDREPARRASRVPLDQADGSMVVELHGREPAQYVALTRPRRYRIVATQPSLCGIEVCVGSAGGAARARLSFALCLADGQVIRERAIDLSGLRSGTWARVEFDELRNANGRKLVVRLGAQPIAAGEVGVFESSRIGSRRIARLVRRLGFAPIVAAPFLRLLYSASTNGRTVGELEGAEGTSEAAPEPS